MKIAINLTKYNKVKLINAHKKYVWNVPEGSASMLSTFLLYCLHSCTLALLYCMADIIIAVSSFSPKAPPPAVVET